MTCEVYLLNPQARVLYAHNMTAALVTGQFVVTAVCVFYTLRAVYWDQARLYLGQGTALGLASSLLGALLTSGQQTKMVVHHKPAVLAAMEGHFESGPMAEITLFSPNPTYVLQWVSIALSPPRKGLMAHQDLLTAQWSM